MDRPRVGNEKNAPAVPASGGSHLLQPGFPTLSSAPFMTPMEPFDTSKSWGGVRSGNATGQLKAAEPSCTSKAYKLYSGCRPSSTGRSSCTKVNATVLGPLDVCHFVVEGCEHTVGVPAAYVQASMDLVMGDLLKNLRSSQIFSVCGLPDVRIERTEDRDYRVTLLGLDVFDPVAMESEHREGGDVPAWFLDTNYNGLCFHVCQAFFPRTSAWEGLKRSLRGEFDDSVWPHLSGTVSAPFQAGDHGQIGVKVVDDRGNELMVVKPLSEAEA